MGSSSKGATTSTSAPPPEVMAQYEKVMAQANQVAATPYTPYTGQLVAGFTPQQQQAFATVANAQGIAQPFYDTATQYATLGAAPVTAQGISQYFNPYQQTVMSATLGDIDLLNKQQQANLESGVESSGGLFNDRYGVAQAELAGQQAKQEAPTLAGIEQGGWTQALNAAQAQQQTYANAGYQFGNLGTGDLAAILSGANANQGMGALQQQLAQLGLGTTYQQWQQAQAYPFQDVSWLSSLSTGLGSNMGGTSTTTPPMANQFAPIAGLGVAALGAFANRGGGINRPRFDAGGGINRLHYDFGGPVPTTPWGNVAGAYIPTGLSITKGSGPPKPPTVSPTNPLDKVAQDAIKAAGAYSQKHNAPPTIGDDPSYDITTGGSAAGVPGLDLGTAFESRGGGIHERRHFAPGGDVGDTPPDAIPIETSGTYPGINAPVSPESAPWGDITRAPIPEAGRRIDEAEYKRPSWMSPMGSDEPITAGISKPVEPLTKDSPWTAQGPSRTFPASADEALPAVKAPAKVLNAQQEAPVYAGGDPRDHLSYGRGIVSMERAKNAIGTFESGNDYGNVGVPTKLGRALGRYQVMEAELPAQLRQAGLPPMTKDEFLANPKAQDKLFETVFGGLMQKHGSFNDAASVWFSGRPMAEAGNRRDALGTTVPMYLANTNAILAKDLGDKVGGGISTPNPVFDRRTGRAAGLARVVDDAGDDLPLGEARKHLFSPETRTALLKAGFALMANRSPYLAQAVGDAGLVGIGSYQESKRYEAAQAQQERKMALTENQQKMGLARLDLAYKQADERMKMATAAQANRDLRTQQAADREARIAEQHPPSYRWADPEHTRLEAVPGGPADPKTIAAASTAKRPAIPGMSPEQQEIEARRIASGDMSGLVGLPRTPEGLVIRRGLLNDAYQTIKNDHPDMTPQQVVDYLTTKEQERKGHQIGINAAARTAGVREENLNLILKAAAGAVPAALEASEEVTRYGGPFVPLNKLIQKGEVMSSNEYQVKFGMANLQLAEHWARAMNPTGVMRESDRDMALHFLDTNLSKGTYKAAVLQLQKQITRERDAIRGVNPSTPLDLNRPTPAPGEGTTSSATASEGERRQFKDRSGNTVWGVFRGGAWQPEARP